ncbi:ADP-forming succinate--CoA ligase subunit beta [candidate division KSB3 bacterium]|uniref:Succinate--CoA ligase [ADP-forming] subunit beta n=1 Tax=candidate division KSB3 bacterium TaxID=2044937 RepID=A0A2G6EAN3_9BACT|nr:MAG: ADP-forming succinate--CoA ligase subunit beta [candidate division KSB3 bacterium]PIE30692.1 MAG: ADP-forming succinate--CoA ligase subunit beta [candidate division KSB3 bacterium]
MKIHEYHAKKFFARYQIPIPQETLCTNISDVTQAFWDLNRPVVLKSQVLTGGRKKAGGIKLASNVQEAEKAAANILGMKITGFTVEKVLVSEAVDIHSESYVAIVNDRDAKSPVMIVSSEGGSDIEDVAKSMPEKICRRIIHPETGLLDFQAVNLAFQLFNDITVVRKTATIMKNLYRCYVETDASLAEINPLVTTAGGNVIALDAKMTLDDNALYRHPEFEALRDPGDDEKKELDAQTRGLSYIKLDGNIGCMVNGAGLAMAAMDVIELYGGRPANFLDIGGSSNPQKVIDALTILLSDSHVNVVMISIFGGIARCDDVAEGLVHAIEHMKITVPIIVRLAGTNEREGQRILKNSPVIQAFSLSDAAQKAIAAIR